MIPYDDLVAALSAWRARQGLPVSTMGGGGSGATPSPGSGPTPTPGSGPQARAGSGPQAKMGSGPARAETGAEELDVDEAALLDEQYETEGNDFAMPFGGGDGEATAIGSAPERPTENDMTGGRGGNGREDW